MKAAFNILPAKNANEPLHLLIEVGNYGISFVWFMKGPKDVKGLAVYNFIHTDSAAEIVSEINNVLASNPVFGESNASVTICYDFKESLLVPAAYNKQHTNAAMLELVYDADNLSEVRTDEIRNMDIHNAYAVDKRIRDILADKFPAAKSYHSTSLQLEKMQGSAQYLYCIIFHNSIKIFLFNEGALQLVQQFSYTKPVDVAYHLMNCCTQYNIKAANVQLQLSGMIDAHSNLYNELYKYFLNITFEEQKNNIIAHERIKFYPAHFFSHLMTMVSCVS